MNSAVRAYQYARCMPRRKADTVIRALIKQSHKLPSELYKSLTWDRGSEMSNHKHFSLATDIAVYFCDPRSSWQGGSNENTNGLLRQYFPKGTDLSVHSQAKLNAVARRLNEFAVHSAEVAFCARGRHRVFISKKISFSEMPFRYSIVPDQ
jgi:IS30 family transposase